jgi:glucose/mannose transport system substrate-binding protein
MKLCSGLILGSGLAGLLLTSWGCAGSPRGAGSEIEIFSWWTAGGEAEALRALRELFESQHPDETIIDAAATGSTNARATLKNRMSVGNPPDTFQANGGWDLLEWVLYNNIDDSDSKMAAIDLLDTSVIPGPVLDTVSFHGQVYAVPLNVHRVNTLFFNTQLFKDAGVAAPTSLDQLFSVAATFQARGITPIALGSNDPWTLPLLLFENLLVARAGAAYYREFFLGHGDALAPEIETAVDDLRRLLTYTNANAAQLTWSGAVELVRRGDAAMTIMGDWAKGYLVSRAAVPDIDFGEIAMPGTDGTFVFTTDTFGLPKGARNPQGADHLLRLFGSKQGQDTFNPIKGSIPARSDADTALYDVMGRRTIADFLLAASHPTSLVPATAILASPDFIGAINTALARFAVDGNTSVVLHTLENWSDVLRSSPWQ